MVVWVLGYFIYHNKFDMYRLDRRATWIALYFKCGGVGRAESYFFGKTKRRHDMNIKIEYDGEYPRLCFGTLVVFIDEKRWNFPKDCLRSGGASYSDEDYYCSIEEGPWFVYDWPKDFPEYLKDDTLQAINDQIEHGCCGGCEGCCRGKKR